MIDVVCYYCGMPLTEPGALIFSVPDRLGNVRKFHKCIKCWTGGIFKQEKGVDMNLVEGVSRQIQRVTEIRCQYEQIGYPGEFGKAVIDAILERGHKTAGRGDATEMLQVFGELKKVK